MSGTDQQRNLEPPTDAVRASSATEDGLVRRQDPRLSTVVRPEKTAFVLFPWVK